MKEPLDLEGARENDDSGMKCENDYVGKQILCREEEPCGDRHVGPTQAERGRRTVGARAHGSTLSRTSY